METELNAMIVALDDPGKPCDETRRDAGMLVIIDGDRVAFEVTTRHRISGPDG